jgi:hypothetical protein
MVKRVRPTITGYMKRVTAKVLNRLQGFRKFYPSEIAGVLLWQGVVRVIVNKGSYSYYLTFDPEAFKSVVLEVKHEVIEALKVETKGEIKEALITLKTVSSGLVVSLCLPGRIYYLNTLNEAWHLAERLGAIVTETDNLVAA